jgi:branched-chain amino acid transport system substrate-binding protein
VKEKTMRRATFALVTLMALLVAACSPATPAPTTAPPASGAASTVSAAAPTGTPASVAQAKPVASPQAAAAGPATGGPITIGVIEALTGPLANTGKDNQDGFNLYLESVGNAVAGRPIQTAFVDSQGQADLAVAKATELQDNDKAQLIAGVIQTPEAYALATWVQKAQIPLIISGNAGAYDLFTNPQLNNPYMVRVTSNSLQMPGPVADWLIKQGKMKAVVITSDYEAGQQVTDTFGHAYVSRGGQIVQELHPPLNTNDFAPFLTQMNFDADALIVFLPGADGVRFGSQYADYAGSSTMQVMDLFGFLTSGPGLQQLKDKSLPFVGATFYSSAYQSPENQTFLKQFQDKSPGREVSADVANGYTGAAVIAAAIQKVNGNVEDTQAFLNALYGVDALTPRGEIKLDSSHDVVNNLFLYKLNKNDTGYMQEVLQAYPNVSTNWDMSPAEIAKFPLGKLKGKWVGMTKDQLVQLTQ